jgi:competence protein ComEA
MTRREQIVIAFLALAIIAGAGALIWTKRGGSRPQSPNVKSAPQQAAPVKSKPELAPAPAVAPARESAEIAVSIQGAVNKPGVYRLREGSRIQDLILAAGGARDADTSDINLAARLIDGTTLTIPALVDDAADPASTPIVINLDAYTISGQSAGAAVGAVPSVLESPAGGSANTGLININTATQEELESLPGIGPKLAQQIIEYRSGKPFAEESELMDVPGIGPAKFEAMRGLISIR